MISQTDLCLTEYSFFIGIYVNNSYTIYVRSVVNTYRMVVFIDRFEYYRELLGLLTFSIVGGFSGGLIKPSLFFLRAIIFYRI